MSDIALKIEKVDDRLFWNIMIGDECIGWVRPSENYSLVFVEAINGFAPPYDKDEVRMACLFDINSKLTPEESLLLKTGGDLDLVNEVSEFLGELGIDASECDEQSLALVKSLRKRYTFIKR